MIKLKHIKSLCETYWNSEDEAVRNAIAKTLVNVHLPVLIEAFELSTDNQAIPDELGQLTIVGEGDPDYWLMQVQESV